MLYLRDTTVGTCANENTAMRTTGLGVVVNATASGYVDERAASITGVGVGVGEGGTAIGPIDEKARPSSTTGAVTVVVVVVVVVLLVQDKEPRVEED